MAHSHTVGRFVPLSANICFVKLLLCILLIPSILAAQPDRSSTQSGYNWVEITDDYDMPEGLRIFNEDNLKAWYVEVDMTREELALHPYLSTTQGLPSFSREVGSLAAINSGYFSGGTSLSTVIYPDGDIRSQNPQTLSRDGRTYYITRGHFGVMQDRSMSVDWIYHFTPRFSDLYRFPEPVPNERGEPAARPSRDDGSPIEDLLVGMGGGPVLIKDGEINITFTEELIWGGVGEFDETRARTAVCYTEDDRALLFVANENPGMAFDKLADVLYDLECHEALNLDGGGSTHMTVGDELVNTPFVNRQIPSILAVVPADSVKMPDDMTEPEDAVILDTEMDNVTLTDGWSESANEGYYGESKSLIAEADDGNETATYVPDLEPWHQYEVAAWWVAAFNRAENTPYIIHHADGVDTVRVDQSSDGSRWNTLGTYYFRGAGQDDIIISNDATGSSPTSFVVADAIRLIKTGEVKTTGAEGALTDEDGSDVPDKMKLGQNYPNPFNPVTSIPFYLPESDHVRVRVYDSLGRLIETLADRRFGPGRHQVTFDAGSISSGMYIYEISSSEHRMQRHMLLIK
ncbi:phosphodiester glycosidase family protein [Natronogracilivirga saccharolytica]|uniref:Phosphodiester glycosidase family protein n=1 Tax=Natronogracilivirga saccharolytica TaxID=2812953 RepID=A0A8J7UWG5_9BACT|nr:phosphodiester glycosidase family protein [Natronogracilivirga saccharolytica]MBP3193651.1 phosphodiester glycosidase family protein [Natronogracilivirga saccharolytica]